MNDARPLILLVYAGVLGWMLRGMWDRTRDRIVADARFAVMSELQEERNGKKETPPATAAG
jgi:hypothetical protein